MNQENLTKCQRLFSQVVDISETPKDLITLASMFFINCVAATFDRGLDKPAFDHDIEHIFGVIKESAFAQIQDLKGD